MNIQEEKEDLFTGKLDLLKKEANKVLYLEHSILWC